MKSILISHASRPLAVVFGLAALGVAAFPTPALAYGKKGHQTVGAVTDELLKGSNAEKKVKALLGTETLSHASTWPDEVKHGPKTDETKAYAARNKHHGANHYADIPLQEKGIHTLHNCAFVDADQPHAVVYPKTLTVTFALWSSKKAVTWRDHVKRLPGVRGREKTLRDLALKLGLRKTLDLKTCEYYDYYPADGAFKGMRERVQFERGPNEDYLQSFFNVLQETGNERLIPLIFESIDGKKIDNPETVRRFAADLRAGKRIPNKYSAGIHTNVPHMNFRAADVVKNLPRSRAA